MSDLRRIGAGSLLVALLGTSAQADVSAADVWQDWKDYYAGFGYELVAASETMSGDTLILRDVAMTMAIPDSAGTIDGLIPEIAMRESGDGRVSITMSPEFTVSAVSAGEESGDVDMDMVFSHSGMELIASGTPDETIYDFTAETFGMVIDNLVAEGEAVPMNLSLTLRGNSGRTVSRPGEIYAATATYSADALDFDVKASDPDGEEGELSVVGTLNDLSGNTDFQLPESANMEQLGQALAAGLVMSGDFSYGAGGYDVEFDDGTGGMQMSASADRGNFGFLMNAETMRYSASGFGSKISAQGATVPFPIEGSIAESTFNLVLPISPIATEPDDFAFVTKLVDLSVSEDLWSMFDPGGQLSHDPATLIIDLSGKLRMLGDIFDPAVANAAEAPVEIDSLDINAVQLTVGGADLTGNGAMTFDNSGPIPQPIGAIDLRLVGGNALLDTLVAMGLVPQDQAMGARMMLGLFTVPAGDDTLTSKIEFREDGGLYANGQRLQ